MSDSQQTNEQDASDSTPPQPSGIKLAKPALDVGLATNQLDAMLAFWQEQAQVPFSEMLPLGGGARQHRHAIGESVLKINHHRDALPPAPPSGLARLEIFTTAVDSTCELLDPDGNELTLAPLKVPANNSPALNLRLHLAVNNLERSAMFYGDVLGLPSVASQHFAVGASQIALHAAESPITAPIERSARGYRYMTLQVFDVVGEHQRILDLGGIEGMPPTRLGDVAYISFVQDPDGNWIEISQRKSITGSLE